MDRAPDNANPTILSLGQLPSRKQKQASSTRSRDAEFERLLFPFKGEDWVSSLDLSSWVQKEDEVLQPEPIDEQEIFDLIATISDPEHPYTLGQLSVINLADIHLTPPPRMDSALDMDTLIQVLVEITPTITHCSLATVIGLAVRVRLEQVLPPNFRVDVRVKDGTHQQDDQVNKQLADKERVAAALENDNLRGVLDKMMETCVT